MFTNLLIVVAAGVLAPLALGFFPRVRLPAIVLEIVLGIVLGPSGLGWVQPDAPVSILALVGLAFLLFRHSDTQATQAGTRTCWSDPYIKATSSGPSN
jgi:Kef-type K+ transport system membrane component KefB